MNSKSAYYLFKLRCNIDLEGDLDLAKQELAAFVKAEIRGIKKKDDLLSRYPDLKESLDLMSPVSYVRSKGVIAFSCKGHLELLETLIKRLSFIQAIYVILPFSDEAERKLVEVNHSVGDVIRFTKVGESLTAYAVPHYAIIELMDIVAKKSASSAEVRENADAALAALLGDSTSEKDVRLIENALQRKSTTSHLSHDLHYYKAKFFPRLARCMLNLSLEQDRTSDPLVIDNFVGSGTTLLEASLLGVPSVGLDIDPLSVLIARTKLQVRKMDSALLSNEAKRVSVILGHQNGQGTQTFLFEDNGKSEKHARIQFPSWLMKNRRMTDQIAENLNKEIGLIQSVIESSHESVRDLYRVLLSDSISRHVRMRFMGTGVGRFALSFSKTPIRRLFVRSVLKYAKVAALFEWLHGRLKIEFAEAEVVQADTRNIPFGEETFSILVTSPPYLPASSGRESYAKGRAPSLLALGMTNGSDLEQLVDNSVGSMGDDEVPFQDLTPKAQNMYEWLANDDLRSIKAKPAARYFIDMREVFREVHRVLAPGGIAIIVSGKQSTFYESKTRDVLYTVESATMIADEARIAGLEVADLHDVQLKKSNMNARPRSLDDYYETLITLRKPLTDAPHTAQKC